MRFLCSMTATDRHISIQVASILRLENAELVVVVLLLNVHGQQLRSCWDGQLT